jgi:CRISPR type III-B/RAMP module RAMP protein Cmr6
VLENVGLCCDLITGLPWIPGTSLKGTLSTWAYWEGHFGQNGTPKDTSSGSLTRSGIWNDGPDKSDLAFRIFGDDSLGSTTAGEIVFVGGFPKSPPKLGLDIVNPHHEVDGRHKSALTPNTFLAVEPGTVWQFVFYARADVQNLESLLDQTQRWTIEVLTQLGLGAKTAAGYGRFRELTAEDTQREAKGKEDAEAKLRQEAERDKVRASLKSDYPNEASFRNSVLNMVPKKGQWEALQKEIEKLKKPENAEWLERFRKETAGPDCKELRRQPWYPK